jgi:peptidoglycan/LPS O-acetylase OafA/YrhL
MERRNRAAPFLFIRTNMIKSLEGGRGIAALIVALYHLKIGADYFSVIRNGYLFVDLFFVLSGFVICAAYSNRMSTANDFQSFLIRRIGRLLPLLLFSTAIYLLAANGIVLAKRIALSNGYGSVLHHPGALEYVIPSTAESFSTITMTHGMGLFDRLILNTPSWSISTEFYTYFLFAILCLLLAGRIRLTAFALISTIGLAMSVIASVTLHDCLRQGGCLSLTYDFGFTRTVFSFFLGALTYHASRTMRFNSNALQTAGAVALAVVFSLVDAHPAVAFSFPVIFALLILSLCADNGWLARILTRKPFQVLGERSYSIYLMHMPLVLFFENIAKRANGVLASAVVLVLYAAVLIIVSGWTYRFIEDPFRARFNRIAAGRSLLRTSAN